MEEQLEMTMMMVLQPEQLESCSIKKLVRSKYIGTVFRGVYILDIKSAGIIEHGKVLNDGTVSYSISSVCLVLNPRVGSVYSLTISGSNKMGAVYKLHEVTVFIPKHKCIDEIVPDAADVVDVKIIGKRIESRIMCIGEVNA